MTNFVHFLVVLTVLFHAGASIRDTSDFRNLFPSLDDAERRPSDLREFFTARDYAGGYPTFLDCADIYLPNGRSKLRSNGRVIRFNCKNGYQLLGKQFSTCIRGRWNTPTPVCVDKGCRELRPPTNGMMRKVDRQGAVYTFACEPGYELIGSVGVYCNRLLWNATVPTCTPEITDALLSCDFETPGLCNWRHETRRDNFDWSLTTTKTPSGYWGTGPSYDHTLGANRNGQYLFIEASSPRKENDNAILVSPVYNIDGNVNNVNDVMCVQLWYHMYGSSTGSLKIHLKQEGIYTQLWNASGNHGDQWLLALVPVDTMNPTKTFQIAIEAVRGTGYAGDIAVDDFSIQFGDNCSVEMETEATWTANSTYSTDYAMDVSTTSGIDETSTVANEDLTIIAEPSTKQMELPTPVLELATSPPTTTKPITTAVTITTFQPETTTIATSKPIVPLTTTSITLPVTITPITTTVKPTTTTTKPTTTTFKPTTTTIKPTTTTTKPTTTTIKPTTTTIKPITTTTTPTTTTFKPTTKITTTTVKLITTTTKPTTIAAKPTTTVRATTTTTKPSTTTVKPSTTTTKPTKSSIKTSIAATKMTTTKPTVKTTKVPLRTTTKKLIPTTTKAYTKPTSTKKPIPVYTKIYTKPTTRKTITTTTTTTTMATSTTWATTVDVGKKPVLPPWYYLTTFKPIDTNDLDNELKPMAHTASSAMGVSAAIAITVVTVVVLLVALLFHVYRKHAKRQKENLHEDSDVRFLKDGEMHVEFVEHEIMQPISFT